MSETEGRERNPWGDPFDLSEVSAQAHVVREVIGRLEPQIEQVFTPELVERTEKIYLTGCGDSHYAGLAARLAFDKYAGVQTEPLESLEFSRYVVDYMPGNSMVVGISNSGKVSRTIETLVLARQRQAYAIGITGDPEGPLAKAADAVLIQTVPDLAEYGQYLAPGTLGLGNFHASLLALYLSAIRIAELRGRIDAAKSAALKKHLLDSAAAIAQTARRNEQTALELAKAVYHLDTYFIIGGGPNYATTLFAAAKIFEQPHASASPQELEEWAHEQYFLTRPNVTPLFVIAPPGNSRDRAIEQIHGARDMGATVIAVCDSEDNEIMDLAHWSMPVYGQLPEEFTPLAYVVPSELFATALHRIKGRPPLIAPFDRERMREVNYRQISGSAIKGS